MTLPFVDIQLSLPQHDNKPDKRATQLSENQDTYRYSYQKPNLRGVAMCADLPKAERASPAWVTELAEIASEILGNAQRLNKADGEPLHKDFQKLVLAIKVEGITKAFEHLGATATRGKRTGPPGRLAAYADLFYTWRLPAVGTEHHLDTTFARMRVAGPNPGWIRQVDPSLGLPDDFGVTPAHYQAAISGDSLEAALAEGRLFLCEYRELLGASPGCTPVPDAIAVDYATDPAGWDAAYKDRQAAYARATHPKQVVAPLALFAVKPGEHALTPVAIQLYPNGHLGKHPVFTPRDGLRWYAAKMCVNAADGNVHEAIAHLGTTHMVQEAFALAMYNCLAPMHPLHRLLHPHFEGTMLINAAADSSLVSPGGGVDTLLMPTIGDTVRISAQGLRSFDFNAAALPEQLCRRGVADPDLIADYPYRDDGLLIWRAIENWVRNYVEHHYHRDRDVLEDTELQAFVRQVSAYRVRDARGREVGGGINGVGQTHTAGGPAVATRSYLVQMVTHIIWNGSGQHAAVNFPQAHEMAYAPNTPLAPMGPLPSAPGFSQASLLHLLPVEEVAHYQLVIGRLLGSLYHTRLGHYPEGPGRGGKPGRGWFGSRPLRNFEMAFRTHLEDIEATIDARNQSRPDYRYLRPSEIPQSINI